MENWAKMGLRFAITIKQNRLMCEICLNLTIKTPKKSQWPRAGVFIINFHKISFFCFHPAEKSYYSENSRKFISFYFSFRLSFVFFLYIIIFWPIDRFSFVSCMVKKLLLPLSASFFFNKKKGKEIQNMFRKLAINRGEETISSVKFSYWEMKQISLYFNIIWLTCSLNLNVHHYLSDFFYIMILPNRSRMFENRTFWSSRLCRTFAIPSYFVTPRMLELKIAWLHPLFPLCYTFLHFSSSEAVILRCSVAKVFLKTSPNPLENRSATLL